MKLLFCLAFGLLFAVTPAHAQEEAPVYRVADVLVDVTSGNAAQARDHAIIQAQKTAFLQLMERLGAKVPVSTPDNVVADMVQSFDLQKEHVTGLRYLATVSVQFKPEAVRQFLNNKGITFTEVRASPVLVLPILRSKGRDTMWEDMTPWHLAWADAAKKAGLVPMIIPQSDLDDIAKIGPKEALVGEAANLQAMMQKYQTEGVIVPVLQADLDLPEGKSEATVNVVRYGPDGRALGEPLNLSLPTLTSAKTLPDALMVGVKQIIVQVERSWRQQGAQAGVVTGGEGDSLDAARVSGGVLSHLPVDVPVPTLAAWAQIRNRLKEVSVVTGAQVISMTRGLVHAEIAFRGEILALQAALAQNNLILGQKPEGGWELRPSLDE